MSTKIVQSGKFSDLIHKMLFYAALSLLFWACCMPLSSRGEDAPEVTASPDEISSTGSFSDFWREFSRLYLQQQRIREVEAEEARFPKVINRITTPNVYPDFSFSGEDDLLEIWFPNIRDQDAAIFLYQGRTWMIDCGDERAMEEIVPLLRYLGVTRIDKLFNTHPHHDHLNGLYSIDEFFPVQELLISFPEDATRHMTAAMEYCLGNGIPVATYQDESVYNMGDGLVSFLSWQKTAEEESINDRSAVFMVSYGSCNILFMADMELRGQRQLLDALGPEPLKADILKYPHHGKKYMLDEVYNAIDPQLVIITNRYRIAEVKESTRFLDLRHAAVAYTHRQNSVLHLTTDGRRWLCELLDFDPAPYLLPAAEATPLPTVEPED